jgi:hypothetical protein
MEQMFERVYKSAAWKEFAQKNMFENIWMGRAAYAKHLAERRVLVSEFLQAVGIAGK